MSDVRTPVIPMANSNHNGDLFEHMNLSGADLKNSRFRKAKFQKVNLTGVRFDGSDLYNCTFQIANLSKIHCDRVHAVAATFAKCDLRGSVWRQSDLSRANLARADLAGASFIETDLANANLTLSNIEEADIHGVIVLRKVTFIKGLNFIMFSSVLGGLVIKDGPTCWTGEDAFRQVRNGKGHGYDTKYNNRMNSALNYLEAHWKRFQKVRK